ncbi:sulfur oxidation c-type cytochrome SoxX [Thermus thermophilus]|uniref:sulfur oxidation c-type cytochrome SoxX n=1 Tax=Thermus thermophilus TaxID=274 RepID=UPI001163BABF|nr:sulfur oxidation c-type cytochrome SoxX [Thermus thermophilus]BBL82675.1 sulfur oxidation c-type cytochrome SoxX [Thermus thermophilus]BBL84974.1 sulfur oxidation c-type cytochrome SoxX [Thermus thermophilus]BCZ89698.1 sulfur oxidation c-type cytochrome SoxX [Thermus thermophilus]BCZ92351.1 sulfur oxidation c-type cytochrome SoxX [Thermus thermophilus]
MKRKAFLALGFLALGLGLSQVGPFRVRLEAAIQTGGEAFAQVMLSQDKAQALCTQYRDKLPPELVPAFLAEQRALIKYPASGKLMGDWKNGEKVFTDPKRGNCYACHQGDPREVAYGTMGPSLTGYGERGLSEAVVRYTYEKIYNAWAFVPCSLMYRGGVHGYFTPEETADLVAYLLSPESPINRR